MDPGIFSRAFMKAAGSECDRQPKGKPTKKAGQFVRGGGGQPVDIMAKGFAATQGILGSSTACILCLHGSEGMLVAANLGDSGFLILRDGKVFFRSPSQQHRFNMPFQLGPYGSSLDNPEQAEQFEIVVELGDIIVLGTDGVFDNTFDEEIALVINTAVKARATPAQMAKAVALLARKHAEDPDFQSPFSMEAAKVGFNFNGGKMDDITVIVSVVDDGTAGTKQHARL